MDEDEEQWIKEKFEGDIEAYEEYGRQLNREMVHWEDLELSFKVFSELEEETKILIEKRLGYLPHHSVTISFEPYLRSLYYSFKLGQIDEANFYAQADEHIKLIRNKDMEPNLCLEYDPLIYENYKKTFHPYGQMAKERIERFLGYEPKLEHSLIAEMWMREILSLNNFKLPIEVTFADYKAIVITKYREVLLSEGRSEADRSQLYNSHF